MINFVVMTDTPARLATFLENRGIIQQSSNGTYTGVRPGMEWVRVPNPITIGSTQDDRNVYLVKFAHQSEANEVDGPVTSSQGPISQYQWSKFGKWVVSNSSVVTAPSSFTIRGSTEPAGNAYKINGENVWLVRDNPERFGVWQ